jgi:hypothetical protein
MKKAMLVGIKAKLMYPMESNHDINHNNNKG